jgi:hypothetical protein
MRLANICLALMACTGSTVEPQAVTHMTLSCKIGPTDSDIWLVEAKLDGSGQWVVNLSDKCGSDLLVEIGTD